MSSILKQAAFTGVGARLPDTEVAEQQLPSLLHIFSSFDSGGTQKRTLEIIRSTAREFTHCVVSMDGNIRAASCLSAQESGLLHLLPSPPILPGDLAALGSIPRKLAVLWRLTRNALWLRSLIDKIRPALILTYNLGAASGLLASRFCRKTPVIHAEDGFSGDQTQGIAAARNLLRRIVTRHVSVVVVPSHALLDLARWKLRLRLPLKLIPNGVRIAPVAEGHKLLTRESLGLSSSELVIGCVAHLRAEKGHVTLLRAFAQAALPNACLLLIGDGPTRPVIEAEIAKLGLATRVRLLGAISDPASLYRLMDIFALASDTEQMPLALLEAMANQLPVVCTDVGDCQRVLGVQPFSAVVKAGDVSSLADSLRLLAQHGHLREDAAARNYARCRQEYGIDKMLRSYRSLYSASIQTSRPTSQEYPVHADRSYQP